MKKYVSILLSVLLLLTTLPLGVVSVAAEVISGQCGADATWTYYADEQKLIISGTGAMYDYDYSNRPPWFSLTTRYIIIEEGITKAGSHTFSKSYGSVYVLVIPSTLTSYGSEAFMCGARTVILNSASIAAQAKTYDGAGYLFYHNDTALVKDSIAYVGSYVDGKYKETITINGDAYQMYSDCYHGFNEVTSPDFTGLRCSSCYMTRDAQLSEGSFTYALKGDEAIVTGYNQHVPSDLVIPETLGGYPVTAIGIGAFESCTHLTSVTIPNSVTAIGDWAFGYCTGLTSLDIPDRVISVGSCAFYGCTALASATFGANVITIERFAFFDCNNLMTMTFGHNLTAIEERAFASNGPNYKQRDIYYTGTEADWKRIAIDTSNSYFTGAVWHYIEVPQPEVPAGLLYEIADGAVTITGYTDDLPSDLVIPATIEGYPVTTIGEKAFYMCSSLTSVTIPARVTTIDHGAFWRCDSLASVTIPNSVTTIGSLAFSYCSGLTSVTIPDSVITIGNSAFSHCSSLTSVTIPDSVTSIGDKVLRYCDSLISIMVDENNPKYSSKDGVLFNKNKSILIEYPAAATAEVYIIPNSVTIIRQQAFIDCSNLTFVTIPDSVATIENMAFYRCSNLTAITIPLSVTSIGMYAFKGCDSLTAVTIPASITNIGGGAFDECDRLTSIEVEADNPHYTSQDGVLFNKDQSALLQFPDGKAGAYTIPASVTTIEENAFNDCRSLTSVVVPDSVTTIGDSAFLSCYNLISITIPVSVTTIGKGAFDGCYNFTDIYYTGSGADRAAMTIGSYNDDFLNAVWHYADDPISKEVTHSVMDTEQGTGLAFRFELAADNVRVTNGTVADYTNATVNYLGNDCKLVGMGAVLTNDDEKGNILQMLRENVNGENMIDIPVVYLYDVGVGSCTFATRLINIPDTQLERVIYARPYYVVEVDGKQITVYGEIDSASCAEYM